MNDPATGMARGTINVPFVLKVLSIGKALAIQAHPEKELASRLHEENIELYPGKSRCLPR